MKPNVEQAKLCVLGPLPVAERSYRGTCHVETIIYTTATGRRSRSSPYRQRFRRFGGRIVRFSLFSAHNRVDFQVYPQGLTGFPSTSREVPSDLLRVEALPAFIRQSCVAGLHHEGDMEAGFRYTALSNAFIVGLGSRNLRGADRFARSWLGRMLCGNRATPLASLQYSLYRLFVDCPLFACGYGVRFVSCFVFVPLFGTSSHPKGFVVRLLIGVLVFASPKGICYCS